MRWLDCLTEDGVPDRGEEIRCMLSITLQIDKRNGSARRRGETFGCGHPMSDRDGYTELSKRLRGEVLSITHPSQFCIFRLGDRRERNRGYRHSLCRSYVLSYSILQLLYLLLLYCFNTYTCYLIHGKNPHFTLIGKIYIIH